MLSLLLSTALAAAPAPPPLGFEDRLSIGFGGGVIARPEGDPLASAGELYLRGGLLVIPAFAIEIETGRVESTMRIPGLYAQEWTPRVAFAWRLSPGRRTEPFLSAAIGADRVRVVARDLDEHGDNPFEHNPGFGPLVHVGGGATWRAAGLVYVRGDVRLVVPTGPRRVDGATSTRPAAELLFTLELRGGSHADADADGILDAYDACPTDPEDKNGIADADGCPDGDRDHDGIPDWADRCPRQAEDVDGVEDDDGCPDLDDDHDGVLSPHDVCPDLVEDPDGFSDDDGCPDPDNDQDGIPDVDDACANDPETVNGVDDTDGCPDRGGW